MKSVLVSAIALVARDCFSPAASGRSSLEPQVALKRGPSAQQQPGNESDRLGLRFCGARSVRGHGHTCSIEGSSREREHTTKTSATLDRCPPLRSGVGGALRLRSMSCLSGRLVFLLITKRRAAHHRGNNEKRGKHSRGPALPEQPLNDIRHISS